jgi:hypothetical protein
MVNSTFYDFIDSFLTVYIDDILVFSATLEEHRNYLRLVLHGLQDNKLHASATKCKFFKTEVEYLGYHLTYNKDTALPSLTSCSKRRFWETNMKDRSQKFYMLS